MYPSAPDFFDEDDPSSGPMRRRSSAQSATQTNPTPQSNSETLRELCVQCGRKSEGTKIFEELIAKLAQEDAQRGDGVRTLNCATESSGHIPFVRACAAGNALVAELLHSHGADVNLRERTKPQENTALHEASARGHVTLVRNLVGEWGASTEVKDGFNQPPILVACEAGHVKVVEFLALHHTSTKHDTWIGLFLRFSTLSSWTQSSHQSALLSLCQQRQPAHLSPEQFESRQFHELKKLLLSPAAALDVHRQDRIHKAHVLFSLRSPLHEACSAGNLGAAKVLVCEVGAHPDVLAKDDLYSPLHCAARQGHLHVVKWLLDEIGVSPMCRTIKNKSVRDVAIRHGHWHVVEYLETKVDVLRSLGTQEATEALVRACVRGDANTAAAALQAGADLSQEVRHYGHGQASTALGHALRAGHPHIAQLIRARNESLQQQAAAAPLT